MSNQADQEHRVATNGLKVGDSFFSPDFARYPHDHAVIAQYKVSAINPDGTKIAASFHSPPRGSGKTAGAPNYRFYPAGDGVAVDITRSRFASAHPAFVTLAQAQEAVRAGCRQRIEQGERELAAARDAVAKTYADLDL